MAQVGREAMAEPYDLLLGRITYKIFRRALPTQILKPDCRKIE